MNICYESSLNENDWDKFVHNKNGDYRQFYKWGILKEKYNWKILRLCISKKEVLVSTCQLLVKTKGPLVFIYLPGSLNGNHEDLLYVIEYIKKKYKRFFFKYFRADLTNIDADKYIFLKRTIGIKKVFYKRSGNTKITLPLFQNIDDQLRNATKKWKKSFRISNNNKLKIIVDKNPDVNLVYRLSRQLEIDNKLGKGHSHDEVKTIFSLFKENIVFSKAYDQFENILGFRAAIIQNKNAWDFFAVTTKHGRKFKAGYPLMLSVLDEVRKRNVKNYYFVGEDPDRKKNVYFFKKGLNGKTENYLGEVEWSNFFMIKILINIFFIMTYSKFLPNFIKKH